MHAVVVLIFWLELFVRLDLWLSKPCQVSLKYLLSRLNRLKSRTCSSSDTQWPSEHVGRLNFFYVQIDIHTWINERYSHSHRVRSASPQVSAFGQILFFLWKWWHVWWNVDHEKKTSLLLQRYTSCVWIHWIVHSLSKNSLIEAKGRRTQDATRDEKGTKWKIVNFMECFRFFMAFGLHPADNVQLMTEVQSAQPCQPSSSTGDNKTLQLWKHSYLHLTFQFTLYMLLQIIMTCLKTVVLRKRACMQTGFASY